VAPISHRCLRKRPPVRGGDRSGKRNDLRALGLDSPSEIAKLVRNLAHQTIEADVMQHEPEFLLYPLDTGQDPVCPDCSTFMMLASHELRETKPDFITFRCKRCGRSEKYICDE
jgi:hypothetical protein